MSSRRPSVDEVLEKYDAPESEETVLKVVSFPINHAHHKPRKPHSKIMGKISRKSDGKARTYPPGRICTWPGCRTTLTIYNPRSECIRHQNGIGNI